MVRNSIFAPLAILAMTALAACSPSTWWGERGPDPLVIDPPASEGPTCAPLSLIFEGSDAESKDSFECLAIQVDSIWKDVRGQSRDRLSEAEIATLARARVFELSTDRQLNSKRAIAIKRILGFGADSSLTREGMREWLEWMRQNRTKMRITYQKLSRIGSSRISYSDLVAAAEIFSEALTRSAWSVTSEQLAELVSSFLPASNPYWNAGKGHMARLAINFVNVICPTISNPDRWDTRELGACLPRMARHFERGAPFFEFWLNSTDLNVPFQPILRAIDELKPAVHTWFNDTQLKPIDTLEWIRFARKLDLQVNERSLEHIRWIRRFDPGSDMHNLRPVLAIKGFEIFGDYTKSLLEGLRQFQECENANARDWRSCQPKYPEQIRAKSKSVHLTLRIRNTHYARQALPYDGAVYSSILLFHAAAAQLIKAFDTNGDGKITVRSDDPESGDENEVADLVEVGMLFLKNSNFVTNIGNRLSGRPIERETTSEDVAKLNLEGLTRLVTLVADTVVWRDEREQNLLRRFLRALPLNFFPSSASHLEQIHLAGVIWLLDSLTTIRAGYFNSAYLDRDVAEGMRLVPGPDGDPAVSRAGVLNALPNLLRVHYPRLYRACMKYGWEITCPIVFDEVLPNPVIDGGRNTGLVYSSALDIMTLTAVYTESLLDACDRNRDGKFGRGITDNNDELDCVFVRGKDMVERLKRSRIIPPGDLPPGLTILLDVFNGWGLLRIMPKIALMRGTRFGTAGHIPIFFMHKHATIGSIFSLVAESMNIDSHRAGKAALQERRRRERELERERLGQERNREDHRPGDDSENP